MVKKAAIICCLFALLFTAGCSKEFVGDFKKLLPLRKAIMEECDVKNVKVQLQNGHCIGVAFVNSKYNNESSEIQDEVRQKTLELISAYYKDSEIINSAWVAFVIHKRYFLVYNYTNSINTRFYEKFPDGTWKVG